ncbi:MAG: inorganic diphosphatase [Bifidobacteriaceae bacterium]|jgi:inorganic pyrophosphatase|nr:inorganic diphosphatase [Bifidobacteriaceae bacterium]
MKFWVTIEIPQGSRNKYEFDHAKHRMKLDRRLFTSTSYPNDYGFIEETLGEDGDPLDALVLLEESTFPGCLILCRAIAMLDMTDEAGGDDKIICVPAEDPRFDHYQNLSDIPQSHRNEIKHFFEVYKELEPDKNVHDTLTWLDRDPAEREVENSKKRFWAT